MSLKILSADSVANDGVLDQYYGLSSLFELPINPDTEGGRVVVGVTPTGAITLSYTNDAGVSETVEDILSEGLEFEQNYGIPIAGQPGEFLIPVSYDAAGGGHPLFGLAQISVDEAGVPTVAILDAFDTELEDVIDRDLYALEDGRIVMLDQTLGYIDDEGTARVAEVGIISSTDAGLVYSSVLTTDNISSSEVVMTMLDDGGTVTVAFPHLVGDVIIVQSDADGVELGRQTITTEQLDALGATSSPNSFSVVITDDGELALHVGSNYGDDSDFMDTQKIVLDLLPFQNDEPGLELSEIPTGDYIAGTDADDVLNGTHGSDNMFGGAGDDLMYGQFGNDSMDGDDGNDDLRGGGGRDYITGDDGDDSLNGGADGDKLYGGAGADDVRGGDGADFVSGGAGDNFLRGNHGDDFMNGNAGADDMNGGYGNDYVWASAGDDKVAGFDGDDTLLGADGNDQLHGGRGADILFGGNDDDVMRGAEGDDTLIGDAGDDLLIGGEGADVYAFDLYKLQSATLYDVDQNEEELVLDDRELEENGTDTIKDFAIGEDKIAIDGSYLVIDPDDALSTLTQNDLTFDDIFLSQEDSFAIIEAGDTTIRLKGVNV